MVDSDQHLLQTTIRSVASMFLDSNRPVYIIDESSWQSYIEHYLHEYGWGSFNVTTYDATTFEFHASLNKGPLFPFTLGIVCGMWERAHGRAYRISLNGEKMIFFMQKYTRFWTIKIRNIAIHSSFFVEQVRSRFITESCRAIDSQGAEAMFYVTESQPNGLCCNHFNTYFRVSFRGNQWILPNLRRRRRFR